MYLAIVAVVGALAAWRLTQSASAAGPRRRRRPARARARRRPDPGPAVDRRVAALHCLLSYDNEIGGAG